MRTRLTSPPAVSRIIRRMPTDFDITAHGAVADGKALATSAIQAAIDAAASAGGGRVVIPRGVFRSGSMFLKQDVELHLADGAKLLGSNDIKDYPKQNTRIEGHFEPWPMALINAKELDHLRITAAGSGTIDGNGILFWAAFWQRRKENPRCTNLEVERPRMFFIDRCTNILLSGLRLRDSGFWNVHLYRCRDVVIEHLDITSPGTVPIRAPSTDGIDVDSCQHVVIRDCRLAVDDDCIALKGSKGPDADKDADSPPVDQVLIERCTFGDGHGVVTLGSEASVVRNVTVRDCTVKGKNALVRLKLRPDTPQLYENLVYENIQLTGSGRIFDVKPWTQFFDLQGKPPPARTVRNLTVRNITGDYAGLGTIHCNKGDVIENVTLENIDVKVSSDALDLGPVKNLVVKNMKVNGKAFDPSKATTRTASTNEIPEWLDSTR
jgi:alpha-L-rhamnosidase